MAKRVLMILFWTWWVSLHFRPKGLYELEDGLESTPKSEVGLPQQCEPELFFVNPRWRAWCLRKRACFDSLFVSRGQSWTNADAKSIPPATLTPLSSLHWHVAGGPFFRTLLRTERLVSYKCAMSPFDLTFSEFWQEQETFIWHRGFIGTCSRCF